jgi:hypothetical protein
VGSAKHSCRAGESLSLACRTRHPRPTALSLCFPGRSGGVSVGAGEAEAVPQGTASAIVTRQGGDGSPEWGKSEPAPGAQRLERGPSASEGDAHSLMRTIIINF